ncbi:M13 family metallopeptidase [Candidatus Saganbacteria bacterium]|uniref:M13 family metallopeptidase n=1 Tax=Candidatus Saganbacteria bacterium TaxID=2575572 RepID=A0A9D6ULC3_UNCSA|nr:M13 family metallopeptidase [Candidatus Saganbacteria bacterium]
MAVLDLNMLDKTVDPANDFYHYAVGTWVKQAKIPADKPMWGFFVEQTEKNHLILRDILKKAGKATDPKSNEFKIGTLFALGMHEAQIEKEGLFPLRDEIERIKKIKDLKDLTREIAHMHLYSSSPFFAFGSMHDPGNSDLMIGGVWQGGLSMPDRDYYLEKSSEKIRQKYLAHLRSIFRLLGDDKALAKEHAAAVLKIETALARVSMDKVTLRDPRKTFHKMSAARLAKLSPAFYWEEYFAGMGIKNLETLNVGQPEFIKGLDRMLKEFSIAEIKTYLLWQLIASMSPCLNRDFVNAHFEFYQKTFLGLASLPPRWKRMVGIVNGLLGEAVGKIYVKEHFPPSSKKKMLELTRSLVRATGKRIRDLDWMEEATKKEALKKLDRLRVKIGYPDKWIDYSKLEIKKDNFIANVLRANYFESRRELDEIGKPADRAQWHMPPQTVNAYFSPPDNEIVFPAAILQPIMFNPQADDAVNYGAIGAVIAHEITHDFDDQGRKYDSRGNLRDWWTKGDDKCFRQRAKKLAGQFSKYVVDDDLHINGELTLGENIADLGGLNIAFTALQKSLRGKKREKINGLTPEDRFFFSWAQVWKAKTRPEYLRLIVKTDPHTPDRFRVNGPLSNMPEFAKAFRIPEGTQMALPASRQIRIW